MNKAGLKRSLWYRVRLRPPARSVLNARTLSQRDDVWIVRSILPNGGIELSNTATGHLAKLGADHIHHFDTDPMSESGCLHHGFFTLTVQIFMSGNRLWFDPLHTYERQRLTRRSRGAGHKLSF